MNNSGLLVSLFLVLLTQGSCARPDLAPHCAVLSIMVTLIFISATYVLSTLKQFNAELKELQHTADTCGPDLMRAIAQETFRAHEEACHRQAAGNPPAPGANQPAQVPGVNNNNRVNG